MSFAQWINDMRWAMNAKRARACRRDLSFSQRQVFDAALRPRLPRPYPDERDDIIAYPDAIYHITIDDFCRAMSAAHRSHEEKSHG